MHEKEEKLQIHTIYVSPIKWVSILCKNNNNWFSRSFTCIRHTIKTNKQTNKQKTKKQKQKQNKTKQNKTKTKNKNKKTKTKTWYLYTVLGLFVLCFSWNEFWQKYVQFRPLLTWLRNNAWYLSKVRILCGYIIFYT